MTKRIFFTILAAGLIFSSCLQEQGSFESEPAISIDSRVLSAGADHCDRQLEITANRGWNIIPEEGVDWFTVSTLENVNIGGRTQTVPVTVSFADNPDKKDRASSFRIYGEGIDRTVYVNQNAIIYRLSISSAKEFNDIDDRGAELSVKIKTNGKWTARVKQGSTADITLENPEGYRDGTLYVIIGGHSDMESGKTATVVISVPDCEDQEIVFNQKPAIPYISIKTPGSNEVPYVNPGIIPSIGGSRYFKIVSNTDWTAKVNEEETTASCVTVSALMGHGDMSNFTVNISNDGYNTDWNNTKKVVIDFYPNGGEPARLEVLQQKASIITFEFKTEDNSKNRWFFANPDTNPGSSNFGTGKFVLANGYYIGYSGTASAYLHSEGLQVGNAPEDYFEFSGIEGHRLIRVTTLDYNGSTHPFIADTKGNTVTGGEYSTEFGKLKPFTWNLEGTQNGAAYRMYSGYNKTLRITLLELEYE